MSNANEQAISLQHLSHFKAKQDLQNLEKFKLKSDSTDLKGAVRYDTAQVLTNEERAQARANLGIPEGGGSGGGTVEGAVRHDIQQILDDDDKARARENIGAGTSNFNGDYNSLSNRTHYKEGLRITWDGNIEGLEKIPGDGFGVVGGWYKVQDEPLDINQLIGGRVALTSLLSGDSCETNSNISEENIFSAGFGQVLFTGEVFYSTPAVVNVTSVGTFEIAEGASLTANSVGVYLLRAEDCFTDLAQSSSVTYHPLEDGFIPDNIPRLDENGLIPALVLPSYVDDVVEGFLRPEDNLFYRECRYDLVGTGAGNLYSHPITGESGKIYLDLHTNNTYRWSGSVYVRINPDEITFATDADIDALFT